MSEIALNSTERIHASMVNAESSALAGLSNVFLTITRSSDGLVYDFASAVFKATAIVSGVQAMTALNSAKVPGAYYYDFETSGLVADSYLMRVTCSSAVNVPQEGELKVGGQAQHNKEVWQIMGLDTATPVSTMVSAIKVGASIEVTLTGDPGVKIVSQRT